MTDQALVDALRDPRRYPHPVETVHVVETHISWVILTGVYAYKLKKPLNLGFLDFSTLEARRHFCEEELRLNRRLDPDLYLEVVAIRGGPEGPAFDAQGPVLEYAVKMREFAQDGLLDRVQERGELLPGHIDALAQQIAAFHGTCERAPEGGTHGSTASIVQPALQNFDQIEKLNPEGVGQGPLRALRQWTESQGQALEPIFLARQREGSVRECHGDLHLGNAFIQAGAIRLFDCIEFNPNLRWIDVMSDVAFMVMDLWHRNHPDLARRFLNAYLERTGDYAGLGTLSFYLVYRALVRAKVALIRSAQPDVGEQERAADRSDYARLLELAAGFAAPRQRWIAITHGFSGAGKSHFAARLVESCDCIRIRSDVERKRAHGLAPRQSSGSALAGGLYEKTATRATYARLAELAANASTAGWPVIADAAFLEGWQRDLMRDSATRAGLPLLIVDVTAADATLRDRVLARTSGQEDASEATLPVLEWQKHVAEPLRPDELVWAVQVDTEAGFEPRSVARRLQELAGAAAQQGPCSRIG